MTKPKPKNPKAVLKEMVEKITVEEKQFKASHKLISEFKALAKLQKLEGDAEGFAQILGNNGRDIPKPTAEQCEIDKLADEFEFDIEEE